MKNIPKNTHKYQTKLTILWNCMALCILRYFFPMREAYYAKDGTSFHVTFDDNILCRHENLSLGTGLIMAQSFSDSELTFAVVILSSPDIKKGETYTISVGSESGEFKAS